MCIRDRYKRGLITDEERYKEVIETWKDTDDAPVSYTHLDVYNRQVKACEEEFGVSAAAGVVVAAAGADGAAAEEKTEFDVCLLYTSRCV